jgi:LPS export ABC transporter protein LptC
MFNIQRPTFRLSLILIAALGLYWALNIAQDTQIHLASDTLSENKTVKPSAFLINSTFYLYSNKGQVSEIHARKAYFFSNSEFIKIDQPSFSSHTAEDIKYTLSAQNGDYHPTQETLLLTGGVKAQQFTNNQLIWTLESEQLLLNNKTARIDTDKPVYISQGKHSLTAEGIEASMNDKKLNLLSKVRGKYVFEN